MAADGAAGRAPPPAAAEAAPLIRAASAAGSRRSSTRLSLAGYAPIAGGEAPGPARAAAEMSPRLPDPPVDVAFPPVRGFPVVKGAADDAVRVTATTAATDDAAEKAPPPEPAGPCRRYRSLPLLVLFVFSAVAFALEEEHEEDAPFYPVVVGAEGGEPAFSSVPCDPHGKHILEIELEARSESKDGGREQQLNVSLCSGDVTSGHRDDDHQCGDAELIGETWTVKLSKHGVKVVKARHEFDSHGHHSLFLSLHHTPHKPGSKADPEKCQRSDIAVRISIHPVSGAVRYQELFGGLVMGFVYVLIIFELVHRTVAAMLGSFVALAVLSVLNKRPSLEVIVGWVDYETVMLLFGMMVMVGILAETGVFEWAAVQAWKLSKGDNWRLITLLILITACVSALLDNVTTILLVTPVTIRMCGVIGLEPRPVLMALVLFSNIGGTATAVGDPPNVLIVGKDWSEICTDEGCEKDIGFAEFTLHMLIGCIFIGAVCFYQIKWMFRNVALESPDTPEVAQAKREIAHWRATARSYQRRSGVGEAHRVDSMMLKRVQELEGDLESAMLASKTTWAENVAAMERKSPIRNPALLKKCAVVIGATIVLFFMVSIPGLHLDLGWVACLGAITLLLWSEPHNLEELLEKVEWGTLLFFGSLFILMEAVSELGLIDAIGDGTSSLIRSVPSGSRQTVAMIIVLWVSALVSAFIDNIPFTTVMIPVIGKLAEDEGLGLTLRPLVWALAFGACLGGNGTLIGASANVVAAGMAEQAGVPISFNYFFSYGFPVMLVSTVGATAYLLVCHAAIGWDI